MSRPVSERLYALIMEMDPFPACGPEMVREVEELEREITALRDAVREADQALRYFGRVRGGEHQLWRERPEVIRALEER